jgi:hypothetical protein
MSRLLTCGECERKVASHVITKKTPEGPLVYRYYHCVAQELGMPDCSQRQCFRADIVDDLIWQWIRGFLVEPASLRIGLEECVAQRREHEQPKRQRLEVVADLIDDHRRQLDKLLDFYLAGDFPRELLLERQQRLEQALAVLEREHADLRAALDTTAIAEIDVVGVQAFAAEISEGLQELEQDFAYRRWVIERLNVTARLVVEDGEQILYVKSLVNVQPKQLSLKSSSSAGRSPGIRR